MLDACARLAATPPRCVRLKGISVFGSRPGGVSPVERRGEVRRTLNARGVVTAPDMETACLILDLSDHGMRLRLDRSQALPEEVVVVDLVDGVAYPSNVVWQKNQEAGLRQSGAVSLKGLVPARLTQAREAWRRLA